MIYSCQNFHCDTFDYGCIAKLLHFVCMAVANNIGKPNKPCLSWNNICMWGNWFCKLIILMKQISHGSI
jgi:hypothetical protein